jgi:hypothetical protein
MLPHPNELHAKGSGGLPRNEGGLVTAFEAFPSRALRFAPHGLSFALVRFDVKLGCTFVIAIRDRWVPGLERRETCGTLSGENSLMRSCRVWGAQRSFDSATASLRETAPALRMTDYFST